MVGHTSKIGRQESNVKSDVTIGRKAPDFDLETDTGERLSLKSLRGQTVILYFYPVA